MHRPTQPGVVALTLALSLLVAPGAARAQDFVGMADSLLRTGHLAQAESLYYHAARRQPRDPAARIALGRYLAARGANKVGAVLLEEARFFGGNPAEVAVQLVPLYSRLGDYRSLASLPGSPLQYPERARAAWLRANPPVVDGPDSAVARYAPPKDSTTLGSVTLSIGGEAVEATIDPTAQGLVLDPEWVSHRNIRHFKREGDRSATVWAGVAALVRLDELEMTNVRTRFQSQGGRAKARIGLDLLGAFAPTFDAGRGRVTLRKHGRVAAKLPGEHIPTLTYASGVWVVRDGVWSLAGARGLRVLSGTRWTLDTRRGEIVLQR